MVAQLGHMAIPVTNALMTCIKDVFYSFRAATVGCSVTVALVIRITLFIALHVLFNACKYACLTDPSEYLPLPAITPPKISLKVPNLNLLLSPYSIAVWITIHLESPGCR